MNNRYLQSLASLAVFFPDDLSDNDQKRLEAIEQECQTKIEEPEALFGYLFAKAMRKRLTGDASDEHIYLQPFEVPQIRLFELLIHQFPFATLSQICANDLIVSTLSKCKKAVLADIGIGTGVQVANILGSLRQQPGLLTQLTVVGVEPFGNALTTAVENMKAKRNQLPFELHVRTANAFAENLSPNDWQQLLPAHYDGLCINASFALHHIRTERQRLETLTCLNALHPTALILTEPNSDHFTRDYARRFANAAHHYGILFEVIDRLAILPKEKTALKLFFSREIDDILGLPEDVRVEKHSATYQWSKWLKDSGFELSKPPLHQVIPPLNMAEIRSDLPQRYGVFYGQEEVTSIFYATQR
ncbi:MAG: GRAS family protein [Runella sp.]